jgi:hypothetical protein
VQDLLVKKVTRMRNPVPAPKRLLITLHWLATGMRFKDLGDSWAIGQSTAHKVVHETVEVLKQTFVRRSIQFPTGTELNNVINDFQALCGLPQCGGAIDGCFIPIKRPSGTFGYKYWCYKGHDAILLLAVVDARGLFTYIHVGNPGSVGDAATYHLSVLDHKIQFGEWLSQAHAKLIRGVNVRPFLVADAAFPFQQTMMKAYTGDPPRGAKEHAYNYAHVRTRRVVEQAFGRLKGRFQITKSAANFNDPEWLSDVTMVCCALHNICERHSDPFEDDWLPPLEAQPAMAAAATEGNQDVRGVRDAIAEYLRAQGLF